MQSVSSVAESEFRPALSSGKWLAEMLILLGLIVATDIIVAVRMDVFGLFRDPTGRSLVAQHHVREAKYLLNEHYVPANYDALIIGASASVNWPTANLTGYRFFNESLEGGNATEQRLMLEQALPRGHFKLALVSLTPPMTHTHELREGFDKTRNAEALGSTNSLVAEADMLMARLHRRPPEYYPDGGRIMPDERPAPGPRTGEPKLSVSDDPQGLDDYLALIRDLQAHGIRIVYIVIPEFEPFVEYNQAELAEYLERQLRQIPQAPVIDFNAPEFKDFRSDPLNFIDDRHLSTAGAETLTRALNVRMHAILDHQE